MLKEIIKECIKDMIKDPMLLLTFDPNEPFDIKSYTLKTLGKGAVYCCETDLPKPIGDGVFYVEQSRVNKKIILRPLLPVLYAQQRQIHWFGHHIFEI